MKKESQNPLLFWGGGGPAKNASPKLILQVGKKGTCKNLQVDKKMKFKPCHTSLLTTGFHPLLGQYFFGGLMIVIARGFIPLSPLSIVATVIICEIVPDLSDI